MFTAPPTPFSGLEQVLAPSGELQQTPIACSPVPFEFEVIDMRSWSDMVSGGFVARLQSALFP